jgi:hypothetical protein
MNKEDLKVGTKVKIRKDLVPGEDYEDCQFTDEMNKFKGKIVTIKSIDIVYGDYKYYIEEDEEGWSWTFTMFESTESVQTLDDLKARDIITLRNGDKLFLTENDNFKDININNFNDVYKLNNFDNNLIYNDDIKENDIIEVERPNYTTIFKRTENAKEPKEMTVSEISEALGYEVKIVK